MLSPNDLLGECLCKSGADDENLKAALEFNNTFVKTKFMKCLKTDSTSLHNYCIRDWIDKLQANIPIDKVYEWIETMDCSVMAQVG